MDDDIIPQIKFNNERKLMVIGAAGSGKSSFTIQFARHYFAKEHDATVEWVHKSRATADGIFMVLDILDTADLQESETKLAAQRSDFVNKLHMLIVVYDITNRSSFERVTDYWYKAKDTIDKTDVKPVTLLIGNKLDLKEQRAVKTEEGEQLARELGMMFGEVSSKTRENMDEFMEKAMIEIAFENPRARELRPTIKATPSHLSDRMSSLLKSPIFSDAVINLNEHKWNVHKFILSARSPVLLEMFKDPSINHATIKGDNISPEAVSALLHYMYTALVDFSPKIASQVAALSAEYKVENIGEIAADIANKGSYTPTSESLTERTTILGRDLLNFSKLGYQSTHPAFDVALKVGEKPVLTSRALLALNSKYFADLFKKNHDAEVQLDLFPNLERWAILRIVAWIYSNDLYTSTLGGDFSLIQYAATLGMPKPFIEAIELNMSTFILNYTLVPDQWLALLNQSVAEQIKKLTEWQAAVQYDVVSQQTDLWKKINSGSRKNIQTLAAQMGTLVEDKSSKRGCSIS